MGEGGLVGAGVGGEEEVGMEAGEGEGVGGGGKGGRAIGGGEAVVVATGIRF